MEYREILETLAEATVKTVKEMAKQTKELVERVEEGHVVEAKVRRGSRGEGDGDGGVEAGNRGRLSYAQVARRAEQENITERARDRTRQLIIDNAEGGKGWTGLTERELVEKAKVVKELMGIQGLDSPKGGLPVSKEAEERRGALQTQLHRHGGVARQT
ncbi:hypothetical protein C0992_012458 [Termitomyces sp. T32_za158]|nr:hypothetical protein C0992_012458 [Termitomyces sp. T32_za158]